MNRYILVKTNNTDKNITSHRRFIQKNLLFFIQNQTGSHVFLWSKELVAHIQDCNIPKWRHQKRLFCQGLHIYTRIMRFYPTHPFFKGQRGFVHASAEAMDLESHWWKISKVIFYLSEEKMERCLLVRTFWRPGKKFILKWSK